MLTLFKRHLHKLLLVAVLVGGVLSLVTTAYAQVSLPEGFEMTTEVSGLYVPTSVISAPDNRLFITEKSGTIRVVQNGQLLPEPLLDISDHVSDYLDRGLLSIALDPDYLENGYIYMLYTYKRPGTGNTDPQTSRLSRVKMDDPHANRMTTPVNPAETILLGTIDKAFVETDSPCQAGTDCMTNDAGVHPIGMIVFDEDENIIMSSGDGANFAGADPNALRVQDKNWLNGKILRIDKNGKGLPSNPFYDGNPDSVQSKIYQMGVRNSFRLHWDHDFGLFVNDVGLYTSEEINKAGPGANFGWPCYEGVDKEFGYSTSPATQALCANIYASITHTKPFYNYYPVPGSGASVIGGTIYKDSEYPVQFRNNYFFADYNNQWMKRLVLDSSGNFQSVQDFASNLLGPVQVFSFDDGDIGWISIWEGKIYRISYTLGNRAPIAVAESDKLSGPLPLTVQFTGDESSDPDEDTLTYAWDFGDGQTSTEANPQHQYTQAGEKTVTLTVSDGQTQSQAQLSIIAGNSSPEVEITSPTHNQGFISPASVELSATASDLEDGQIPAEQVKWKIILHHNEHIHVELDNIHAYQTTFSGSYHGNNTYYEVQFSVTDSAGTTTTKTRNFYLYTAMNVCQQDRVTALYSFENNTVDSAPFGLNTATAGPGLSYQQGRVGQTAYFGEASFVDTPEMDLANFTFNFWLRPENVSNINHIIGNRDIFWHTDGFSLFWNAWNTDSKQLIFEFGDGTNGQAIVTSTNAIQPNIWQMVTVTYDGSTVSIYKNGQLLTAQTANLHFKTKAPLRLGQFTGGAWQYRGGIDDLAIWSHAMTGSQVAALATNDQVMNCNPEKGQLQFRVIELDTNGQPTGTFVDDAVVALTDVTGTRQYLSGKSHHNWVILPNVPTGNYGVAVYKPGYKGSYAVINCNGEKNLNLLQNALTQNNKAAWNSSVPITSNAITWCRDVALQPLFVNPSGYQAEYWNLPSNTTFPPDMPNSPADVVRSDAYINFNWDLGSPTPGIQPDKFVVRWTKTVQFEPGVYRFVLDSDDGIRLYVDSSLVVDEWNDHAKRTNTVDLELNGNHTLKVEYYENSYYTIARMNIFRL